jgi:hypothetical protein
VKRFLISGITAVTFFGVPALAADMPVIADAPAHECRGCFRE